MKVSNLTGDLEMRFGLCGAIKMNLEAGFDAIDISFHQLKGEIWTNGSDALFAEMRDIVASYGATFNQAHAPFPCCRFPDGKDDEKVAAYNRETPEQIKRSLEICGKLGIPYIVIHPIAVPNATESEQLAYNLEHFAPFLACAKNNGVKIMLENMWGCHRDQKNRIVCNVCSTGADLARYVDAFDDPDVVALLDIGHSGLVGTTADQSVRELGARLKGIHLHDNDFFHDTHTLPFLGNINYDALIGAMIDTGYAGDVTFEVGPAFYGRIPDTLIPDALRFQYRIGAYFRDRVSAGIAAKKA